MALEEIPIRNAADNVAFYFIVDMDGTDYQCSFRWNSRDEAWYMSLYSLDGTPIRTGIKLVVNWPVFRLDRSEVRPSGEVLFVDADEVPSDPVAFEGLGKNASMIYFPAADIVELFS